MGEEATAAELLRIPGVVGVSFYPDRVVVYVRSEEDAYRVPLSVRGLPVQIVVVGEVKVV